MSPWHYAGSSVHCRPLHGDRHGGVGTGLFIGMNKPVFLSRRIHIDFVRDTPTLRAKTRDFGQIHEIHVMNHRGCVYSQ